MENVGRIRNIVLAALFAAVAVLLSGVHIPAGPIKAFPFQHAVNIVAGVVVGPWYAALSALLAAIIRNAVGTGTPFAFPGGIPGGIVVGLVFRWVRKDWAAFTEPVGTGLIGVSLSVLILGPIMGKQLAFYSLFFLFMVSSIPGTVIGYVLLKALHRAKVLKLEPLTHPPA